MFYGEVLALLQPGNLTFFPGLPGSGVERKLSKEVRAIIVGVALEVIIE